MGMEESEIKEGRAWGSYPIMRYIEWRLTCDGVGAVIVDEFSVWDFICPGTRVRPAEDPKIHFDLLVNSFSFTIGLGVVCSGEGEVVVKEFAEFFGEGGGELGTLIRDNFVIESEA